MSTVDMARFRGLLGRVRAGDGAATAELVRQFEPPIRCEARLWMTGPRLARLFDSADVCQSVLASPFLRAACGAFDLDRPEDLAGRRAAGRPRPGRGDPARPALGRDLVEHVRLRLGPAPSDASVRGPAR